MMELIVIGMLVAGAVAYLIISTHRSIKEPKCDCDSTDKCPYSKSICSDTDCPLDKNDS